jgi:hypothetical protein
MKAQNEVVFEGFPDRKASKLTSRINSRLKTKEKGGNLVVFGGFKWF